MNRFLFFVLPFLVLMLCTGEVSSADEELDALEAAKKSKSILDYDSLLNIITEIKKSKNQFRVKKDFKELMDQYANRYFYIRAYVKDKSNYLVSGKQTIWLEPDKRNVVALINFKKPHRDSFDKIQEFQFITVIAKFITIKKAVLSFEFIRLKHMGPIDTQLDLNDVANFNTIITRLSDSKKNLGSKFERGNLRLLLLKNRNRLGHITGTISRVTEVDGEYVVSMKVNDESAEVQIDKAYIENLAYLESGHKVSVVARCRRLSMSLTGTHEFFQGCFYSSRN